VKKPPALTIDHCSVRTNDAIEGKVNGDAQIPMADLRVDSLDRTSALDLDAQARLNIADIY